MLLHLNIRFLFTQIYKAVIRDEESKTGEKSKRNYDATPQQAAADPEVKLIQTASKFHSMSTISPHLFLIHALLDMTKLKDIIDQYLTSIIGSLNKMPYGIRYIGNLLKETMKVKELLVI